MSQPHNSTVLKQRLEKLSMQSLERGVERNEQMIWKGYKAIHDAPENCKKAEKYLARYEQEIRRRATPGDHSIALLEALMERPEKSSYRFPHVKRTIQKMKSQKRPVTSNVSGAQQSISQTQQRGRGQAESQSAEHDEALTELEALMERESVPEEGEIRC